MSYKTCPDCGCRIYEYGYANCNEQDYIDMQQEYEPPPKVMIKGRDDAGCDTRDDHQGGNEDKIKKITNEQ